MNRRILIIDGTATNRIIGKVRLSDAFYTPILAPDGETGLRMARGEKPDLILLGLPLPDYSVRRLMAALRADPATRNMPVIALTPADAPEPRIEALGAGVDDVMARPADEAVLFARIRSLLRLRAEAGLVTRAWGTEAESMFGLAEGGAEFDVAPVIGVVTARPETGLSWRRQITGRMRDRLTLLCREQVLGGALHGITGLPDVLVIEADLDGTHGGLRLMSQMISQGAGRMMAFCVVTPPGDAATAAMAFDLGADEVITPHVLGTELDLRLRALLRRKRRADRLRQTMEKGLRLAMIDPLTGSYNRRYAMPRLAGIAEQAAAEGSSFAVMVVDLDRFKSVNDRHGHAAGDAVLIEVARRLTENLRITDLLARIGGEEFLVVLPQTGLAEAQQVAERLRQAVGEQPVPLPSGEGLAITVSIGVAIGSSAQGAGDCTATVEQADRALMSSKTAGRNLVTLSRSAA
ncbi:diguanylate cyclase [Neotabrizicola sp. VNH66]|uniref:diguanylate cyclase n=1 Tax=Neotabrizicola sp. VNH66 TaxID=3400918 RepID=UPI003C0936AD